MRVLHLGCVCSVSPNDDCLHNPPDLIIVPFFAHCRLMGRFSLDFSFGYRQNQKLEKVEKILKCFLRIFSKTLLSAERRTFENLLKNNFWECSQIFENFLKNMGAGEKFENFDEILKNKGGLESCLKGFLFEN